MSVPNFPSSRKSLVIRRNGLANSFREFLKTFQNKYSYITFVVFSFLGNKMYKIYHILLAGCNHLKGFQKLPKYFEKFQKTK